MDRSAPRTFTLVRKGVAGFLLGALIAAAVYAYLSVRASRRTGREVDHSMIDLQLTLQSEVLEGYLEGDPDRRARARSVYDDLLDAAAAGKVTRHEAEELQREFDRATKDQKLESDEFDRLLDVAVSLRD